MSEIIQLAFSSLNELGEHLNLPLEFDDGQCNLFTKNGDLVISINVLEHQELLVLHCPVSMLPDDPGEREARSLQLLALNGNPAAMGGAWFCIDEDGRHASLMTSFPATLLQPALFINLVTNFISLNQKIKDELTDEMNDLILQQNNNIEV